MPLFRSKLKSSVDALQVSDVYVNRDLIETKKIKVKSRITTIPEIIRKGHSIRWRKTHSIETDDVDFDISIRWIITTKTENLVDEVPFATLVFGGTTLIPLTYSSQVFGGNTTTTYPYYVVENSLNLS